MGMQFWNCYHAATTRSLCTVMERTNNAASENVLKQTASVAEQVTVHKKYHTERVVQGQYTSYRRQAKFDWTKDAPISDRRVLEKYQEDCGTHPSAKPRDAPHEEQNVALGSTKGYNRCDSGDITYGGPNCKVPWGEHASVFVA